MATSQLTSPLGANAFARCSESFLEQLDAHDLEALELELAEAIDREVAGVQASELEQQNAIDTRCAEEPLLWAQNYTQTENPHYLEQGLPFRGPFPVKPYFVPLFEEFKKAKRLLVPKSREMMTSWCAMVWAAARAQWHQALVVVQAQKEDKVQELIGYAECLYRNQVAWMKARHPLKGKATLSEISWASGGRIIGIPKGIHQIRTFHPTIAIFDEAAFLEEFGECWNTTLPVARQMIAISSAGPGTFATMCAR